jgi:nucleoside-diphosphate-sugar epimerase
MAAGRRDSRVLVTGGADRVGSRSCRRLQAGSHGGNVSDELRTGHVSGLGPFSFDPKLRPPDDAATRRELGWEPHIAFQAGSKRTCEDFLEARKGGS